MKTAVVICALVLAASAVAQMPGPIPGPALPRVPGFPAALRLYLELSDTQVENINFLNNEFQRWAQPKQRRMNQVQQELNEALNKEPLDPMALGLATAEIEATRRQFKAEFERTRAKIRAVLSERQQPKLKALEDIFKLWPIYSEAVQVNLLESIGWFPMPVGSAVAGGIIVPPGPGSGER